MHQRKKTHPASELLEENGIVADADCLKVEGLPKEKFTALYQSLYESVRSFQKKQLWDGLEGHEGDVVPIDPFSFVASASLRSDFQCEELLCRLKKLDTLARYAALYANEVTVPLSLDDLSRLAPDRARALLRNTCLTMTRVRPLIDAGIVTPAVMESFHCEHKIDWVNEMIDLTHLLAQNEARLLSPQFKVTYQLPEKSPSGRSTVYIDGPSDFVEHGGAVVMFDEGPQWRLKSWRFDSQGKTEVEGVRKAFLRKPDIP